MGSALSKAANGFGCVVGNAFAAPIKTIFGASCEDVCSGPWDFVCFIEHLCVSNLLKLLMILVLSYITLMFFYLLFKVGICQCICRSLCKMCCAACATYCCCLQDITCFLWHKLKNTKRVNRQRIRDIEAGYTPSSESDFSDAYHHLNVRRKQKSVMGRQRVHSRRCLYPSSSRYGSRNYCGRHHHVRLKTREVSVRLKGRSRRARNSRSFQVARVRNPGRGLAISNRRPLR